jgi:hypothetical protein
MFVAISQSLFHFTNNTSNNEILKKKSHFILTFEMSLLMTIWGQRIFFLTLLMALCRVIAAVMR